MSTLFESRTSHPVWTVTLPEHTHPRPSQEGNSSWLHGVWAQGRGAWFGLWVLTSSLVGLRAAQPNLEIEVKKALESLGAEPNYSWSSTTKSDPPTSIIRLGPTAGKTELNGYTYFGFTLDGNLVEVALHGSKSAIKTESAWESSQELTGDRQWMARRLQAFKPPVAEAEELLRMTKTLRNQKGGILSGDLSPEGVRELLLSRSRNEIAVRVPAGAKGSVKFWVKGGRLVKFEYNLQGKIVLLDHQQEFKVNRTTVVEISHIGSTRIQLPDEAKKKLAEANTKTPLFPR